MNLTDLQPPKGQNHRTKRVGRGFGSGMGKTSGRGGKRTEVARRLQPTSRL